MQKELVVNYNSKSVIPNPLGKNIDIKNLPDTYIVFDSELLFCDAETVEYGYCCIH